MAQQKRYKLLIWFYLHNHLHKSIHAAHSMEVELTRKTEVSEWVDENDESIAKEYKKKNKIYICKYRLNSLYL